MHAVEGKNRRVSQRQKDEGDHLSDPGTQKIRSVNRVELEKKIDSGMAGARSWVGMDTRSVPAEKMELGAERRADVENTIASAPIVRS